MFYAAPTIVRIACQHELAPAGCTVYCTAHYAGEFAYFDLSKGYFVPIADCKRPALHLTASATAKLLGQLAATFETTCEDMAELTAAGDEQRMDRLVDLLAACALVAARERLAHC